MGKMIYLDNAATTKTAPEVVQAMMPYFSEYYGNPSSIYDFAGKSKEAITRGREQIAEVLGAKKEEIYFTAGGSESDNWALKAAFEAYKSKGNHIITTKIEHHAILHTIDGDYETRDSLLSIEKRYAPYLLRCHQSYLVNPEHVIQIQRFRLHLTGGITLPIPEKKYTSVKAALLK